MELRATDIPSAKPQLRGYARLFALHNPPVSSRSLLAVLLLIAALFSGGYFTCVFMFTDENSLSRNLFIISFFLGIAESMVAGVWLAYNQFQDAPVTGGGRNLERAHWSFVEGAGKTMLLCALVLFCNVLSLEICQLFGIEEILAAIVFYVAAAFIGTVTLLEITIGSLADDVP